MKEKIITISFLILLYGFALLNFVLEDKKISAFERRNLTSAVALKEDFNENLDLYLTDQFPFRDQFLTINNSFHRFFLNNQEFNDVYLKGDYIIEKNYPLDEKSLTNFIHKMNAINTNLLINSNAYYAIIPDKSYFLNDNKYLKMDYGYLFNQLKNNLDMSYIDIEDLFNLEDYYKTDIHIKQSSYFKLVQKLSACYDFKIKDINYENTIYHDFKGTSFYKVPFSKKESLMYLSSDLFDGVSVKHLEYEDDFIYKKSELTSLDAYNVFLSGPSSLIEIENSNADNDKELILFRDSFGSSLAPLLIPYYKKITLIDLRYISMKLAQEYVDFTNKDVLFLYSTLVVNSSYILKIY